MRIASWNVNSLKARLPRVEEWLGRMSRLLAKLKELRWKYEEGTTESNGTVLRSVPAEWLLPFLHQRYDDPTAQGVEIAT